MKKQINLNWDDRFVKTNVLRSAYLHYEDSLNPTAPNYLSFEKEGLELGIVSSQVPEIANAVSSILSRSLEDAKFTKGGYLPTEAVERVQENIISPHGIATLWGTTGHRFVMSRPAGEGMREVVASILIARSKDTIFFFTGRYNNLKQSTIKEEVDLSQPNDANPDQKWFDRFSFPDLERFKPALYHQIANFVVIQELRRQGLARFMVENIVKFYSRDHLLLNNDSIVHSQHLLCGQGFWQIGDPPWLVKMRALGFYLREGAENFFIERDWAPLTPIVLDGKTISNIEYNQSYGLPQKYLESHQPKESPHHMPERIPEVIKMSQSPKYKLQYFQAMYDFL